jgi:hypothetical protein
MASSFAGNPVPPVVVVSGLPRSGTSMMMRMLQAGGVPPLTDSQRGADEDNPLGYFELEAVKATRRDPSWLTDAPGKAVKLIHILLQDLPGGHEYRVLMMRRDLDEVVASQAKMLERSAKAPAMPADALKRVYQAQLAAAERWMDARPWFLRLDVSYNRVLAEPLEEAARVEDFLGLSAGTAARMAAAVDPTLYRNRRG